MYNFSVPDKLKLAQLPTPIQHLPRLSRLASVHGPVDIYVKRDDFSHGPAAGNKIRKLEYFFKEALQKGLKVVFTCGGLQSNHARATALLARQLGLECVLFLNGQKPQAGEPLHGNLLLDRLCGARIEFISREQYDNIGQTFLKAAEPYRKRDGKMPLLIPEGGSNDIGVMGYVAAFEEIVGQAGKLDLPEVFDSIVSATGSGGTQAGLILGRNLFGWDDKCEIIGFNISRTSEQLFERVKWAMIGGIQRWRLPISFMTQDIQVIDGYVGPGYAKASEELFDFISMVAREEGLILDPVYTGKALYGLFSELKASKDRAELFGQRILFIHTGGLPSVFNYGEELTRAIVRSGL